MTTSEPTTAAGGLLRAVEDHQPETAQGSVWCSADDWAETDGISWAAHILAAAAVPSPETETTPGTCECGRGDRQTLHAFEAGCDAWEAEAEWDQAATAPAEGLSEAVAIDLIVQTLASRGINVRPSDAGRVWDALADRMGGPS